MKLIIDEYEVDIKVKHSKYGQKANKTDTMNFLNTLSIFCTDSARLNRMLGTDSIADEAEQYSKDIYEYLEAKGAYGIKVS